MPKKQRYTDEVDTFDADFFDDASAAEFDANLSAWDEQDILAVCGNANAAKGLALYQKGRVTEQAFNGIMLQATVQDDAGTWRPKFDLDTDEGKCLCPAEQRGRNVHCEHIAAMLYLFINEPARFNPQTLGAVLGSLESNPALRAQLNIPEAQLAQLTRLLATATPELRAALDQPTESLSPQDLEKIQTAIANSQAEVAETELRGLLDGLSQNQLRAIAQRRDWTVSQNKHEMVTQLTKLLRDAPAPTVFTPEEEQLLRLENTLYGLKDVPSPEQLTALWKRRSGGDMARLEKARSGLANAGLLLECRRERTHLHYHWSPLLHADTLPLLVPKVAALTPHALARWQVQPNTLSVLDQISALLEFVARTPLPVQLPARDPQLEQHPYLGAWNYDPADARKLTQPRYVALGATEGIHVPFPLLVVPQALDTVADALGLTGSERDMRLQAMWLTGQLLTAELVDMRESERLTLDPMRLGQWHILSPDAQLRQLWERWRIGGTFEFLWLEEHTEIHLQRALYFAQQFTPVNLQGEVGHARSFIARLLTMLEPQTWYAWDTFTQYVHNLRADFLHTQFDEHSFWLAARDQFKYSVNNPKHWDTAYRAFLTAQFESALRWFGIIEVAHDGTELAAFQITPLGAWLLRNESEELFPAPTPIAWTSDEPLVTWLDGETFRIRGGPNSVGVLAAAHTLAEPTSVRLTFHVSNEALARSWERGSTPETIIQKFSEAGAALPDALRARLEALYANYGRVHLYEKLTVLELADDFAARELMASTSLRQYILHQFSPRIVVIRDDAVDKFVLELEKKGYTPRVV